MLVFRKATEEDVVKIAEMEKATFGMPWSANAIQSTMASASAVVIVAEKDEMFAGYCIVYHSVDESEIARIVIAPELRRCGIGRGLLNDVCAHCKTLQMERLLLEVREGNQTARSFYRAYGFAEDGIRKNYYDNPKEDAVLMSMII